MKSVKVFLQGKSSSQGKDLTLPSTLGRGLPLYKITRWWVLGWGKAFHGRAFAIVKITVGS
jgi:hypothetical protein